MHSYLKHNEHLQCSACAAHAVAQGDRPYVTNFQIMGQLEGRGIKSFSPDTANEGSVPLCTCLCPFRRLEFFLLRFLKMSTLAS